MKKLLSKKISGSLLVLLLGVSACGGNTEKESSASGDTETSTEMTDNTSSAPEAKLNINTASGKEFQTIPNVGDKMEHEFEEYRPYVSIRQFRKEIGKYVDEAQVAEYEKFIFVPIHRNDSDAATIMQIPGLDESEAEKVLSGRPYETNQAFLNALSSYISKEELATAQSYLKT